jgi:hypothetical protein
VAALPWQRRRSPLTPARRRRVTSLPREFPFSSPRCAGCNACAWVILGPGGQVCEAERRAGDARRLHRRLNPVAHLQFSLCQRRPHGGHPGHVRPHSHPLRADSGRVLQRAQPDCARGTGHLALLCVSLSSLTHIFVCSAKRSTRAPSGTTARSRSKARELLSPRWRRVLASCTLTLSLLLLGRTPRSTTNSSISNRRLSGGSSRGSFGFGWTAHPAGRSAALHCGIARVARSAYDAAGIRGSAFPAD